MDFDKYLLGVVKNNKKQGLFKVLILLEKQGKLNF